MVTGGWWRIIGGKESESADSRKLIKGVEHRSERNRRGGGGRVISTCCTILQTSRAGSGRSGGRALRSLAYSQAGSDGGWERSIVDGFGGIPRRRGPFPGRGGA